MVTLLWYLFLCHLIFSTVCQKEAFWRRILAKQRGKKQKSGTDSLFGVVNWSQRSDRESERALLTREEHCSHGASRNPFLNVTLREPLRCFQFLHPDFPPLSWAREAEDGCPGSWAQRCSARRTVRLHPPQCSLNITALSVWSTDTCH